MIVLTLDYWSRGVVWFNTLPCQGRNRRFKSGRDRLTKILPGKEEKEKFMAKKENQKMRFTGESYLSLALGALVVIVIGVLAFNAFKASTKKERPTEGEVTTGEETTAGEETPSMITHKVVKEETLWLIAEKYFGSGYNWVDIATANNLSNPNYIEIDQELTIPKAEKRLPEQAISGETYTVVKGDSLWNIAIRAYGDGFAWTKIAQANNLANPNLIHAGNVFTIPR